MKILVINGPSLNMLGIREPELYGRQDYNALVTLIEETCAGLNIEVECFQSNHEGAIVDRIQEAYRKVDAIIINPAGYTHTSVAILDALRSVAIPAVEGHLTDVRARESFRHISYAGLACEKSIAGRGFQGYVEAIHHLKEKYDR